MPFSFVPAILCAQSDSYLTCNVRVRLDTRLLRIHPENTHLTNSLRRVLSVRGHSVACCKAAAFRSSPDRDGCLWWKFECGCTYRGLSDAMVAKLLIVEDEPGVAATLRDRLRKRGVTVTVARTGRSGLDLAIREHFDLIILDITLPGRERSANFAKSFRALGLSVPILMLSARRQTEDKVAGLKAGGDDYLAKPFQMAELLARCGSSSESPPRWRAAGLFSVWDCLREFKKRQRFQGWPARSLDRQGI